MSQTQPLVLSTNRVGGNRGSGKIKPLQAILKITQGFSDIILSSLETSFQIDLEHVASI